eukprot:5523305-Prymnesium_polylepis.2
MWGVCQSQWLCRSAAHVLSPLVCLQMIEPSTLPTRCFSTPPRAFAGRGLNNTLVVLELEHVPGWPSDGDGVVG